ncbi:MAG: flagellar protein FlaG [Proteobacteria bacterium]|uniref:Flagellar protein FlaG n=1 Tax=Candidatus Avisuccinivibrio stercorigallinarum TaxID=2840704 RepID=A0A9D9DDL2_9GAMM|nr:flagellar protein FlaG [Candidatus Avisuccinivibrio stercorigallinarum]
MDISRLNRTENAVAQAVNTDLTREQAAAEKTERQAEKSGSSVVQAQESGVQNKISQDAESTAQVASQGAQELQQKNAEMQDEKRQNLEQAIDKAREYIGSIDLKNYGLSFSVEQDLDKTLISVTDRSSDKVIRQIPSEEFVQMAKNIREFTAGDEAALTDNRGEKVKTTQEARGVLLDQLV